MVNKNSLNTCSFGWSYLGPNYQSRSQKVQATIPEPLTPVQVQSSYYDVQKQNQRIRYTRFIQELLIRAQHCQSAFKPFNT